MIWIKIILAGVTTFLTRFLMINLIKKNSLSARTKVVLSYVPSAVFPAIIFPAIFLDINGKFLLEDNPKIIGAIVAVAVGYFSKSTLATIILGLISYWTYIYLI
jgi:branched-subunit amino acid transport protein